MPRKGKSPAKRHRERPRETHRDRDRDIHRDKERERRTQGQRETETDRLCVEDEMGEVRLCTHSATASRIKRRSSWRRKKEEERLWLVHGPGVGKHNQPCRNIGWQTSLL